MTTPTEPARNAVGVKVVYKRGTCVYGHEVGDEWVVGNTTPAGICNAAYIALYPFIRVYQLGGRYEFPRGSGVARMCCPDAWNQVIFELTPIPATDAKTLPLPPTSGHLDALPR